MKRTSEILQQETDRDQVKKDAESAGNAVMRISALAVHIADGYFADRSTMPGSQGRNEAVEFAVKRDLFEDLAAVGFESGSEIVNVHPAEFRHQPIGTTGRNATQPEIVDALLAPPANDVIALGDFLKK